MRTKPCLTSADVKKMMAAAMAEAGKNNWKVTVAIVDDGGFMLHLERMDGAADAANEFLVRGTLFELQTGIVDGLKKLAGALKKERAKLRAAIFRRTAHVLASRR